MSSEELDREILNGLEAWVGRARTLKVLSLHRASAAETIPRLAALTESPDRDALLAIAHRLAGGAATVGLTRLAAQGRAVEAAVATASDPVLIELARDLLGQLVRADEALAAAYPELREPTGGPEVTGPDAR